MTWSLSMHLRLTFRWPSTLNMPGVFAGASPLVSVPPPLWFGQAPGPAAQVFGRCPFSLSLGALTSMGIVSFTKPMFGSLVKVSIVFRFRDSSFSFHLEHIVDDPFALQQFNLALRRWCPHLLSAAHWELGIGDALPPPSLHKWFSREVSPRLHRALRHRLSPWYLICMVSSLTPSLTTSSVRETPCTPLTCLFLPSSLGSCPLGP